VIDTPCRLPTSDSAWSMSRAMPGKFSRSSFSIDLAITAMPFADSCLKLQAEFAFFQSEHRRPAPNHMIRNAMNRRLSGWRILNVAWT